MKSLREIMDGMTWASKPTCLTQLPRATADNQRKGGSMKKPHEQTWCQKFRDPWSIRDEATGAERARVFTDNQAPDEATDVARLISAAPDMARALLALTATGQSPESLSVAISSGMVALRKAGVL